MTKPANSVFSGNGAVRLLRGAERFFWPSLALYVFVLPIQHTIALRYLALAGFLIATIKLLASSRRSPSFPLAWPWLAYFVVALMSLPHALAFGYSTREIRVEIVYCVVVFIAAASASSLVNDALRRVSFIGVAANAIYVLTAFANLGLSSEMAALYRTPSIAFAGVNSNLLTTVMPLVAYAALTSWQNGRNRLAGAIGLLLALDLAALIMSYNRQSIIALGAGVFCAGILIILRKFTWRRLALLALAAVLVVSLLAFQFMRRASQSSTDPAAVSSVIDKTVLNDPRWPLWELALQGIAARPWTGSGFGRDTFSLRYPELEAEDGNLWHAHNMVLNKGIQMGIPGMLTFLLLWIALTKEFAMQLRGDGRRFAVAVVGLSTLAAVFTKNMTDDFFVRDMGLLFWLLMGFYIGTLRAWAKRDAAPAV